MILTIPNVNELVERYQLPEITSPKIWLNKNEFDPEGLFSEKIFGIPGSEKYRTQFAYIDLGIPVSHPQFLDILHSHARKIFNALLGVEEIFLDGNEFNTKGHGQPLVGFELLQTIVNDWQNLKLNQYVVAFLEKYGENILIDKLIVIPPAYRPIYHVKDMTVVDPINNYYTSILQEKQTLTDSSWFIIQNKVYKLFKHFQQMLAKKSGLIRDSILGKRVDFSGRAVISADSTLKPYEAKIPRKILARIAQPYIIHEVLYGVDDDGVPFKEKWKKMGLPLSTSAIKNILDAYYKDVISNPDTIKLIKKVIDKAVEGKVALIKRDPALHRFNWRGVYIKPTDDLTIHIPLDMTEPIGGDFDGDTMAVYMPMTEEAQTEVKSKIMFNILNPANNSLATGLKQDAILGWYYVTNDTIFKPFKGQELVAYDEKDIVERIKKNPRVAHLQVRYSSAKTNYKEVQTILGRLLLNLVLPNELPWIDETFRKSTAKKICQYLAEKVSDKEALEVIDKLYKYGCLFATLFAPSMPLDEFKLPESFYKKVEKLKEIQDPVKGQKYLDELLEEAKEYVKKNCPHLYAIFDSGCRGSWDDFKQMAIAKGYVTDTQGRIIPKPIAKGLIHNLTAEEYFIMSPAARKGIVDRSINTAKPGYLTRRLAFAASSVLLGNVDDCKTTKFLKIKVEDEKIAKALIGRYLKTGEKITTENYKDFVGKEIEIRSPIYCKSPQICKKCYGDLWKIAKTKYIGILAAQSVGERGTQLIMKTFHTGGAAEIKEMPVIIPKSKSDFLIQDNTEIYANKDGYVEFEITEDTNIEVYEDQVQVHEGTVVFVDPETEDFVEVEVSKLNGFSLIIYFDKMQREGNTYRLYFLKDSKVADVLLVSADISSAIDIIERLFEVRIPKFKEAKPEELLMEIYKYYKDFGLQLVHFEVILSNMYRSKKNPTLPCRLTNDECILVGIKKIPFYESPLLALGFENVKRALEFGLLFTRKSSESPLEKLLTGELEKL